jgi:hypothetical protein
MLIGYVRVSKSDGTQTLTPQRDALLAADIDPARIYEDLASGRHDDRPGALVVRRSARFLAALGKPGRHRSVRCNKRGPTARM